MNHPSMSLFSAQPTAIIKSLMADGILASHRLSVCADRLEDAT
jgi:hypothetical protein